MASISNLLTELEERTIAQRVGIPHDEARMRYQLRSNTVSSFDEFTDVIGDYLQHHFSSCVSIGGSLPRTEATGRAKEIVEREYRRKNGNIVSAFNNAQDGTHGGLRAILDIIAEGLKAESVQRYIRDVFDRHVAPSSWEDKVDIIRQFIAQCGVNLSSSIQTNQPERYAQDYEDLIRSYVTALQQTSSIFRRL